MASPQWKNFQPSLQDSAIHAYQRSSFSQPSSNSNNLNHLNKNSPSPSGTSNGLREAGIVEKLLHSYGFIQCCERQARLFFHYSQFSGNIEHLKLGDPVEFEMTYDRRTGKPIASAVVKISTEALSDEVLSSERVSGFVTTEVKDDSEGRVAYESRGECFFLPYTKEDLDVMDVHLNPGDKVTFQMATDKCTGNLRARNIRLEKPQPQRHQGVICTLKETFGFIERDDVVKEIFFHSSECKDFKNLNLGDDVEFTVHTRNNKEVATNIVRLPFGTVVFDDIADEIVIGQVTKVLDRQQTRHVDPMSGKICYRRDDREMEISFGEKGTKGEFTLQEGSWVQFNIATDRRDQLQHATNIDLLDENFLVSNEISEHEISSNNQLQTSRIRKIPTGTIKSMQCSPRKNQLLDRHGEKESGDGNGIGMYQKGPKCSGDGNGAHLKNDYEIFCNGDADGEDIGLFCEQEDKKNCQYFSRDNDYQCESHSRDKSSSATAKSNIDPTTDIKIAGRNSLNGFKCNHRGFVAAMKDGFGFIETEDHDREIFFHFSAFDGNINTLEIGQEVEYALSCKGSKLSAENVHKLPSGTIPGDDAMPEVLNGTVIRPVRCFNPEQEEYCGLIQVTADETMECGQDYPFGITSLAEKHELLQKGDVVQFQIGVSKNTGQQRAINIKAIRTSFQATVDTIKGNFGFLSHEVEEGKKLFFHMSEVKGGASLQSGDKVEFVILHHQRTGKYSACRVVKIGDGQPTQRPERLISRLRSISSSANNPRFIVVRQPRGPDGTKGFKVPRQATVDSLSLGEMNVQISADTDIASCIDPAHQDHKIQPVSEVESAPI